MSVSLSKNGISL